MNIVMLLSALLLAWTTATTPVARVQEQPVITTQSAGQAHSSTELLSAQAALTLIVESRKTYWHVETGGQLPEGLLKTFTEESVEYYDIGSDVDTPDKFTAYLEKSFTKETAEAYLQKKLASKFLVMHNGRLAKINADRGSLLDWERSKVSLVKESAAEMQFRFQVPIGDDYGCETYDITFHYIDDHGWRVSSDPEALSVGTCPIGGAK